MPPRVGSSLAGRNPVGPIDPATKRCSPAALRDLRCLEVDLERVLAEAPLVELQPAALEGVGLDDLGAGFEHRSVDALDRVGPVEHQGLVALALEATIVLGNEIELLQGRAHAAVEDDDALSHRGHVFALGHGRGE
jgi:hypothetical protein